MFFKSFHASHRDYREEKFRIFSKYVLSSGGMILVFASAFFVLQRLTFLLRFSPYERTTVWVPGALTFAALLLLPYSHWWRILVGLCLGVYTAFYGDRHIPEVTALASAPFHFATVGLGVRWLRQLTNEKPFSTVASMLLFVLIAGVLVPLATTLPGDLIRWIQGVDDVIPISVREFLCIALGVTIATPAFTCSLSNGWRWIRTQTWKSVLEVCVLNIVLIFACLWVFAREVDPNSITALIFVPVPFLMWAALRFEVAGTSWSLLAVAYISSCSAIQGKGPFLSGQQDFHILNLQLFLLALSWPLLLLAAGVAERSRTYSLLVDEMKERCRIEDRLRLVLDSTPTAILMIDERGRIVLANKQTETYFGYSSQELLNLTFESLILRQSTGSSGRLLDDVWDAGASSVQQDCTEVMRTECGCYGVRKDGSQFPIDSSITPIDISDRQLDLVAIIDISERVQAEQARQELVHASRITMLSEFTTSIAHEINQPLGAILSNAEAAEMLLQRPVPPLDEVRGILEDIRKDDLRASDVIKRLRSLLRRGEVERIPIALDKVVSDAVAILKSETNRRGIQVQTNMHNRQLIIVGDRVHLQQVLLNLMINSMEAMDSVSRPKRLEVSLTEENGAGVISVTDSGPGVPKELVSRLFDRFYSTKAEGMGMGLAISQSLVERHGGKIWLESSETSGATFRVSLPLSYCT